jgi:hypothetical protein
LFLQNRAKRDASPSFCGLQNIIIDVKRGSPNGDRQNQPAAFTLRSGKVFPATMLTGRQTNSPKTISEISIAKRSEWKTVFYA